jgi:MFS family permease
MNIPFTNKGIEKKNMMQGIKEGFLYSFGFSPIRSVLLLLVFVSLMGAPYMVLMPVFAKDIFHGGSHTLGFLMSAAGGGALAGAVFLASRKTATGLETVIPCVTGIFGFGLIAFSLSRWFLLSLIILFATGFSMIVHMASSNTILQTIVDEEKRGRVMSFYVMCVMGTVPFGSLLSGTIASTIGTPVTIFIGGVFCIAGTLLFVRKLPELKKSVRQIYIEKGVTS